MTKNHLLFFILLLIGFNVYSQKINLKKGKVLVNEETLFSFQKENLGSVIYLKELNTFTKIIYIEINNNNTITLLDDDFVKIIFYKNDITIKSNLLIDKNFKKIIQLFFIDKVINLDGDIDAEKLNIFSSKYNNMADSLD